MISARLPRMSLLYRIWILGAGWLLLAGGLWAVDWVRLPGLTAFETQSDVPLLGGGDPTAMTRHPVGRPNMLWEFTDRLVLQTSIPELIAWAEADVRLKGGKRVEADIIVFQAMDARTAMEIAGEFSGLPGVDAVYPVFRRPMELNSAYAAAPEDAFSGARQQCGRAVVPGESQSHQCGTGGHRCQCEGGVALVARKGNHRGGR